MKDVSCGKLVFNNCSSNLRVPFLFFIFVYVWFEGKMSRIQVRCFGKPVRHCQFSVLAMLNKGTIGNAAAAAFLKNLNFFFF